MNDMSLWIIIGVIVALAIICVVLYLAFREKPRSNTDTDISTHPMPQREPVIDIETIETVNIFFNQIQERYKNGHDDALSDDTVENLREGLLRIKSKGKDKCDSAILCYEKEIIKLDNEIAEENSFVEGNSGDSTRAKRKIAEKENIQKNIEYLKKKIKDLDSNDLSIYASYKAGFAKGRSDNNR